MNITIKITLDDAKLKRLIAQGPKQADTIVRSCAFAVEGYAKVKAPVDTGALSNSIKADHIGTLKYYVGDGVTYGIYQELGTSRSRMRAHPFMIPAVLRAAPFYEKQWHELFKGI